MLLSLKMIELLNAQISHEFNNQSVYRNIQAYFSNLNLNGWAKYFEVQAQGEYAHYEKVISYLDDKNADYQINVLPYTSIKFPDITGILKKYYDTEILTTQKLYAIEKQAHEEGDYGTVQWLHSFLVPEQIEEEGSAINLQREYLDGVGGNFQLDLQWARVVDERLMQRMTAD